MAREITPEEKQLAADLLARARRAMDSIKGYDQAKIDRLCQAIGWATGNEKTFLRIAQMGVDSKTNGQGQHKRPLSSPPGTQRSGSAV